MRQLFLDCDGVLADFDKKAIEIFKMHPREFEAKYGAGTFWKIITKTPDFFYSLDAMEDAHILFKAVEHLSPIVLTGVPPSTKKWAPDQKRRWIDRMFGEHIQVITCASKDKKNHGKPGDVIVDDWPKYKHLWEEMGGVFVLHTSAENSIEELRKIKVL